MFTTQEKSKKKKNFFGEKKKMMKRKWTKWIIALSQPQERGVVKGYVPNEGPTYLLWIQRQLDALVARYA